MTPVHEDAAVGFDRAIRRRAATESIPLPHGLVVRHAGLPAVHHLNAILLDQASPDGSAIVALAERWLGDRGHRHLIFNDVDAGERAAAGLADRGWERERILFMAFRGDPAALARDRRARQISEAELLALQQAAAADQFPAASSAVIGQLVAAQRARRETTPARRFGAGDDDDLASMCTLFLGADVAGRRMAMVDDVGTLSAHRECGLARAVVTAAVVAAAAWGADLITVPTDADDWPQLMYARLGFALIGRQVALTLTPGGRPAPGSGSGAV